MVYSQAGPVTKSSDMQVRRTGADSCIAGLFVFNVTFVLDPFPDTPAKLLH